MTSPQRSPRAIWSGILCAAVLGFAASASAQGPSFTVGYTLPPNQNTLPLTSGGTVQFPPTPVNTSITATISVVNTGTAAGTITAVSLAPSSAFQLVALPLVPATVNPGGTFIFGIRYTPASVAADAGTLTIGFGAGSVDYHLAGSGITPQNLIVSYTMPPTQNTVPLSAGGTVQFPATQINTSTTGVVSITNTGTTAGSLTAVAISGPPFQLLGLGLLPATINPGQSFSFGVRYTPTQAATDTGSLTITIAGTPTNYVLAGSGIVSAYSYTMSTPSANTTVSFPDTNLGSNNSVFIQVRNVSGAAGTINAINATGAFAVSDGPTVFPVTVNANGLVTFTLTFTPAQPGEAKGKLTVGNDVFDLAGTGLGPKLTFSYGSANTTVVPPGTVIFSPTQVGQSSQVNFKIANTGTSPATVTSIAVADTRGVFTILNPPSGAVTINPGDSFSFQIAFAPALTGFSTTTLQIDTQSFTLSGSGTPPPALPAFQFTGSAGNMVPLQQAAIGLSLSAPYSLPLNGTLTISVNSGSLVPDPSVQFATGGKTISFTIAANSTDAVFPTGGNQIGLQVGTTAASISITPAFSTRSGLDITPLSPPVLTLTVAPGAPKLRTIQVTNVSQAAFSVGITGLSTTRSLTTLNYQFTPAGGGKPVSYSIDVSAAAGLWYSSTASQNFGGQFSVAVPFALPNPSTTALSTSGIKSISVTASNAQGTSDPVSLTLQ